MRKKLLVGIAVMAVVGAAVALVSTGAGQLAIAGSDEMSRAVHEYRFTKTVDSGPSPGLGHEAHQIVRVLEPSAGIIYSGTLTYVTSQPIDIVVLHEMDNGDARGQAIWRIDDDTVYGWTFIDIDSKAGSFEYSGAGLLLHTGGDEFTATVTVDGRAGNYHALEVRPTLSAP